MVRRPLLFRFTSLCSRPLFGGAHPLTIARQASTCYCNCAACKGSGVKLRRQMRNDFGLDGNDLNACASYTICSCLSVIQDANEYQMQADASLRTAPGQQAMTK